MKITIKFLVILLLIVSCSKNENDNLTIISGELQGQKIKSIEIELKDSIYSSYIDNNGKFQIDIPLKNPQYVYVKGLDKKLFLLPNDSLKIEKVDGKYVFHGGQTALINNYYAEWKTYLYAVADTADSDAYYNQEPKDFLNSNAKWIEIWRKPLNELQKQHSDLNEDFIAFESARIKYWMYGDLNDYQNSDSEISDSFYQYLDKVNLNDRNLMQQDEYRYFLTSYIFMKARRLEIKDKINATSKMLDIIEESFHQATIRNTVSKEIIRLQTSRLAVNDSILKRFSTICTNQGYIKAIETNYKRLQPLLKGNPAPDFELLGLNGDKVTLNDFKGKYLLLDIWSTTCTPCLREFPILEDLKHDLIGKNIEIIAACLSDEAAWKKALVKYNLKGGQYRIENGWKSEFRNDYIKSSGVPIYILIDPNGILIDARAPKPSENLYEVINKLEI